MPTAKQQHPPDAHEIASRAGWSISDWCASVNLSRATLYTLPPSQQPASVKIGKRRIITEQPDKYLKRLASQPYAEAA